MELSPATRRRLKQAADQQAQYIPAPKIQTHIAAKTLVMVIAPTAMGKTFVMNQAITLDPEFARVSVVTTRQPRSDDQGMFRYVQPNEPGMGKLLDKIEAGELVQYAIFPASGQLYGSEIVDFPKPFNLLATLSNSVTQLERVGFRATIPIGLITDPEVWLEWFDARYHDRPGDRPARLKEALLSLDWLLAHDSVRWLINEPGRVDAVARQLIALVRTSESASSNQELALSHARRLRDHISQMVP